MWSPTTVVSYSPPGSYGVGVGSPPNLVEFLETPDGIPSALVGVMREGSHRQGAGLI